MKTKKSTKRHDKLMKKMKEFVYEFYRKYPITTVKLARD